MATSTCPTTPRTERAITMSVVIRRQGISSRAAGGYPHPAGVAELVRRARLKIGWPSGRAGSSPAPGIARSSQPDENSVLGGRTNETAEVFAVDADVHAAAGLLSERVENCRGRTAEHLD